MSVQYCTIHVHLLTVAVYVSRPPSVYTVLYYCTDQGTYCKYRYSQDLHHILSTPHPSSATFRSSITRPWNRPRPSVCPSDPHLRVSLFSAHYYDAVSVCICMSTYRCTCVHAHAHAVRRLPDRGKRHGESVTPQFLYACESRRRTPGMVSLPWSGVWERVWCGAV